VALVLIIGLFCDCSKKKEEQNPKHLSKQRRGSSKRRFSKRGTQPVVLTIDSWLIEYGQIDFKESRLLGEGPTRFLFLFFHFSFLFSDDEGKKK
jgi:hypothetical protein